MSGQASDMDQALLMEIRGQLEFGVAREAIASLLEARGLDRQLVEAHIHALSREHHSRLSGCGAWLLLSGIAATLLAVATWGIKFAESHTAYSYQWMEGYWYGGLILGPVLILAGLLKLKDASARARG